MQATGKGDQPLDLSSYYYLAMDWKNNEKMKNHVMVQSKELDYDSDDQEVESWKSDSSEVTLEQCLQLFTEPEVLSPQEAWYCPQCKEHREATKQLSLWRLPTVLIIQLKRFSFKTLIWRDKISRMVEFPVRGLDLSSYFCGPPGMSSVYDLFAVINHQGGILGGHYTAYARCVNPQNTRRNDVDWRLFDDSQVVYVNDENKLVTRAAYMLFYRRRGVSFSMPQVLSPYPVKSSNKEQKQKENLLDLELTNEENNEDYGPVDSNILTYGGGDSSASSPLSEVDTVD